ncbi:MAG TPA: alanine racemase [Thermoanaerobaculia bacterium]
MSSLPSDLRPTWVEIDLEAFDANTATLASLLPRNASTIAVLKADAYGHGAVELARRCERNGIAMIAVALIEEGLELRRAGISLPVLVLGPLNEQQIRIAVDERLTLGIPGPEELELAARVAQEREVVIHLKIDSGMGRMGCVETEFPRIAELLQSAPNLHLEAIYTHFANASDPDDPMTSDQLARFDTLLATLRQAGISAPRQHAANSAAVLRGVVSPGDFVRIGLALVGGDPLDHPLPEGHPPLRPVMRWRTEIARLKELPAGHVVGYGATFRTARPSRIATLPVGYADGYGRRLSNRGEVLVRGQRVPVVGRVSMDLVTIDVTDVPEAAVGDEVILMGGQGEERITVEELAVKLDTISHEVFCAVGSRVPRIYAETGRARIRSRFQ